MEVGSRAQEIRLTFYKLLGLDYMTFRGLFQPKLLYDAIISQSSLRTHSSQSENKKFCFLNTIQNSVKIIKTSPNFSITYLNRSETKPRKTHWYLYSLRLHPFHTF